MNHKFWVYSLENAPITRLIETMDELVQFKNIFKAAVRNLTLAVNKQNCVRLAEQHCSRSYFSLFMSMTNHAGTGGLLRSGTTWTSLK